MAEALKNGETDKAADLQAQQTRLMTQYTQQVSKEIAQQTTQSSTEDARYDSRVSEVEQTYPQLNVDANEFDESLAGRVTALRDAYQAQGYAPADALDEALTVFEPLLQPTGQTQTQTQNNGQSQGETNDPAQQRKEEAVQRNIDAQQQQPPNTQGTGHDSSEHGQGSGVNVKEMSEEEYEALPEDTLRRLRGDDG